MNPRRERFQQAMARFEPAGNPVAAVKDGLYVAPPGQPLAERILARLELRPRSAQLVVGAIGAGKTTQLRILERALGERTDLLPIFVDATSVKDELQRPGKLVKHVVTGIERAKLDTLTDQEKSKKLLGDLIVALLSTKPQKPKSLAASLGTATNAVLLLDSLDRLPVTAFEEICGGDLATLREHMAVVVVGPPAVMYGAARALVDRFDYFERQPTYDPRHGSKMHDFLVQIVRQRAEPDLIPDASSSLLVEASGGILRDLVALAQLALEEAYVTGHERVEAGDVHSAVDAFGRKHIYGLDSRDIDLLQKLRQNGSFVRVNDNDTSLLITRRVLEYADDHGAPHFAVHPTLLPLLQQMDDA